MPANHEQYFKCGTCGATLEDKYYKAPTQTVGVSVADAMAQAGLDQAVLTAYATRAARTASRAGRIVATLATVGVLGGTAVGAWGIYQSVDANLTAGGGFKMYSFSNSALFPGEGDVSEIAVVIDGPDQEHLIYADLGAEAPVRWNVSLASLLPADASIPSYERIVASPGQVLITYQDRVYAFDRTTGAALYQLDLKDSISNICDDCLRILPGNRAAALSSDGTLQVWDAATGRNGWSMRLRGEAPRQLLDVEGNPAAIVGQPGAGPGEPSALVTVYSAADGSVVHTQAPRCDGEFFSRFISPYDHVVPLARGGYVWLGDCPQRWSAGATEADWVEVVPLDEAIGRPAFDNGRALVHGEQLVAATDAGYTMIDLGSGQLTNIARDEVTNATPIGVVGNMLVATEQSERGSRRWSVVGVDLTDPGGQAAQASWEFALTGDPGEDGFITDVEWIVGVVPAGVAVLAFDVDGAAGLRTQIVDPASGAASPATATPVTNLRFTEFIGWRDGNVLLGANHRLYAIDPATATVVAEAP